MMEHRRFGAVIGCAVALGLVLAPAPASTHEGEHEEGAHATGTSHADTKTVGELWRGVKVHETEWQRHEVAFALRDLVAAMPDQSAQLPPERFAKLQGNVKYVGTIAERLDAAGDANDQAATGR
jgi:hypothetical protein